MDYVSVETLYIFNCLVSESECCSLLQMYTIHIRGSRKSQVLIAIDQLMTEMILCLSSLHFSSDVRQECLGPFSF